MAAIGPISGGTQIRRSDPCKITTTTSSVHLHHLQSSPATPSPSKQWYRFGIPIFSDVEIQRARQPLHLALAASSLRSWHQQQLDGRRSETSPKRQPRLVVSSFDFSEIPSCL
ncbi:hypothetical protein ACLOJK_024287 [Asimina triloba]